MKKRNLLAVLACATLLVACDVDAKPQYVEDKLVSFTDNAEVYKNDFTDLYDSLVDAGTSNSSIVDELMLTIAKKEIGVFAKDTDLIAKGYKTIDEVGFLPLKGAATAEERFEQLVDEYMVDKVMGGQYSEDYLFQEDKFAREQREALYIITDKNDSETGYTFNENIDLVPGITYAEIFSGRKNYEDYREKVVKPIIYERLLTAKYLYNNKYKTIGRSAARDVRVIEIDNSSAEDKGSALRTLNNYVGGFLYASSEGVTDGENFYPEVKDAAGHYAFDVESISNIWKGIWRTPNTKQEDFVNGKNLSNEALYTLHDDIEEDLAKIADKDANGEYKVKAGLDVENSTISNLLSEYTGSYSYPISWGVTLEERKLNAQDLTEDDFFVEKTGLTGLPSSIRNDLFSMTVSKKLATVGGSTFLLPEQQQNSEFVFKAGDNGTLNFNTKEKALNAAANLIHYDANSSTYYVVLVDAYDYSTTDLAGGESTAETVDVTKKNKAIETAVLLGENSTYQEDSLLHYFEEYGLTYHDDAFYEYLSSTYEELFEE